MNSFAGDLPEGLKKLLAEQERSWREDQNPPLVEHYQKQPGLPDDFWLLHMIWNEYDCRDVCGVPRPKLEEYKERFPHLSGRLDGEFEVRRSLEEPSSTEIPSVAPLMGEKGHGEAPTVGEPPYRNRLGNYELLTRIGEGGQGTVYLARHVLLDQEVALKILRLDRVASEDRARFLREFRAMGRLNHPNIVQVYNADEAEDKYFLVMERLKGASLKLLLDDHLDGVSIPYACGLVRQAAEGLQEVHTRNLVHRDIKPSNLMLTDSGEVKILDLGLAKLLDSQAEQEQITQSGYTVGTPAYMSPEQLIEPRSVDHRSDLYSLGLTFYELLTGGAFPNSGHAAAD